MLFKYTLLAETYFLLEEVDINANTRTRTHTHTHTH